MNCKVMLYIFRDYLIRNIIYLVSVVFMTLLLIATVSGLGFYMELKDYFAGIPRYTYIYSYDGSLSRLNRGIPNSSIPTDNTAMLEERMNLIKERFNVNTIERSEGCLTFSMVYDDEERSFDAVDYGNSFLKDTKISIVDGRLPGENEKNVLLLNTIYKSYFDLDKTYSMTCEGKEVSLKVIGFFENPYYFNADLKVNMETDAAIVFSPTAEDGSVVKNPNSNILIMSAPEELSEQDISAFMRELGEDPKNFYRYDGIYEYEGEEYTTQSDADTLFRKMLISFALLFSLIFAEAFFGMERIKGYILTLIRLGMSHKDAIKNVLLLKGIIIVIGMLVGTLIFRSEAGISKIGGISISASFWSWKYVIISIAVALLICILGHLPYVVGIYKTDLKREE